MATRVSKPLTGRERLLGGTMMAKSKGEANELIKIGPVGPVNLTPNITEAELRGDEKGFSELIATAMTAFDATIEISEISQWTAWLYDALFLTERKFRKQTAASGKTETLKKVHVGGTYKIPGIRPEITSVTGTIPASGEDPATTVTLEEWFDGDDEAGKHFSFNEDGSVLEIIALPAGLTGDLTVTYSVPEITDADKLVEWEMYTNSGWEGSLYLYGATQQSTGEVVNVEIDFVQLRPNGPVGMKDSTAFNLGALSGRITNNGTGFGRIYSVKAFKG